MTARYPSPLRYPGGKRKLAGWLAAQFWASEAELWLEPFGGGAGAAIAAVQEHGVPEAWIVERNPALAAFWRVALDRDSAEELAARVAHTTPTLERFHQAKATLAASGGIDLLDLAEAAFLVNRCSRSGIITPNVGPIGGRHQSGRWTVASRFDGPRLATRLRELATLAGRLHIHHGDGIEFLEQLPESGLADEVFVFADPPYLGVGNGLYAEGMHPDSHTRLASALRTLDGAWICTYDVDERLLRAYPDCDVFTFAMHHTAHRPHAGEEFLIAPRGMVSPGTGSPTGSGRLTALCTETGPRI